MQSVVIAAPRGTEVSRFARQISASGWKVEVRSPSELVVELGDRHALVLRDDHLMEEFEESEISRVLELVPNPIFFVVEYNDFGFGKMLLERIADSSDLAIDDDHGDIVVGSAFADRLRRDPSWDWRQ